MLNQIKMEEFKTLLNLVPDDVILGVAAEPINLSYSDTCLVSRFVSAMEPLEEDEFTELYWAGPPMLASILFGSTTEAWQDMYSNGCFNYPKELELAFVARVDECVP